MLAKVNTDTARTLLTDTNGDYGKSSRYADLADSANPADLTRFCQTQFRAACHPFESKVA